MLAAVCVMLAAAIGVNTWQYRSDALARLAPAAVAGAASTASKADAALVPIPAASVIAERLAAAIRFPTISHEGGVDRDEAAFEAFRAWLAETYPRVFAELSVTQLNQHALLFEWAGVDATRAGALFAAHYDVVPVIAGTESAWTHPPFAGVVADGYVWGRGALDNKNAVVGLMEAIEALLAAGFRPQRTIYLALGHDEEIGGAMGAAAITEHLRARGARIEWSLDEGSFVMQGVFPGLEAPVAIINTAEKGMLTLTLTARGAGGHSSMPPAETAVGTLARALVALQSAPLPGAIEGLPAATFDAIGPHLGLPNRALFANRWLFGPLLESELSRAPTTNAMLRTTTAPTMLRASPKANVLPIEAVATVNFRVHPRDSTASVTTHVETLVAPFGVAVEIGDAREPSVVSDHAADGFTRVANAVRDQFGPVVIAPGLMVAGSDSRHYGEVVDDAYRFNPMRVTAAELTGFHGTDERIDIDGLARGVATYARLLQGL